MNRDAWFLEGGRRSTVDFCDVGDVRVVVTGVGSLFGDPKSAQAVAS